LGHIGIILQYNAVFSYSISIIPNVSLCLKTSMEGNLMTRKIKYRLLSALILIMLVNSTFAETYYSKSGSNPSVPAGWNTSTNGTGANAVNFTTPGDIFILQSGQTLRPQGNWTIGTGVTLRVNGTIQFLRNSNETITINGTVIFTSNVSQVSMMTGGGNSSHTFTLSKGAKLITSNSAGIHGVTNASILTNSKITVNLSTSADYEFNGSTQSTNGLPSTVRNLVFSGTGTKTAVAPYAVTQNLSIETGATFAASTYNHTLQGDWINNGGLSAGSSTVSFSGADTQTIGGSSSTSFNNLTIAKGGTSTVGLNVNTAVTGTLSLTNGYVDIANYSLAAGSAIGGSANSYVRTSGTGRLKRTIAAGETILFPVGNTAYNPASITSDATSGSDVFNLRVTNESVTNANESAKTVNRRWYITKDAAGTIFVTAHLTYNTGEEQTGFNAGVNPFLGAFSGAYWSYAPATVNGNTLSAGSAISQLPENAFLAIGSGDAFSASGFAVYVSPANPVAGLSNSEVTINSVNSLGVPTWLTTQTNFNLTSTTGFNGISSGTIPNQNYEYHLTGIQFTTVTTDATVTATRTDDTGELLTPGTSAFFNVVAGTIWEPTSTGNWDAITWRSSADGGLIWTNPASLPINNEFGETDLVYIPSGIILTANVSTSLFSLIIEGSVDLVNNGMLTLNHSTGDQGHNIHVHGSLRNSGGTFINSNELLPIEIHGGSYEHARDGGSIPVAEWYTHSASISTCIVNGIMATALSSGLDQEFENFTWDNAGQAVTQNLHGEMTVGNELTLTNGVITTGENFVIKAAAGSISRTNGYISGNFRLYVPNGTDEDICFPVGDAASYAPIDITFNGTTSGSGYLDAFTEAAIPPVASGLSREKYINRKWSVIPNGVNFTSYTASFTFSNDDKVGSPLTSSLILRQFSGYSWYSTNAAAVVNVMSESGLTSFGEFMIGEDDCSTGNATWFGGISTDWNTPGNWCSGSVPTAITDVFIPGGIARYPVIGPGGAKAKNIHIDNGASLSITGTDTLEIKGEWNNGGTFISNTGTVTFNGSSAQIISGTTAFYNLHINNPFGVTAADNLTTEGNLFLQSANVSASTGTLDMRTYELFMGTNSITSGIGDLTGIVTRNHVFSGNTPYSFGSPFTTLTFINVGDKPTSVSCRISIGSDPGWFPVSPDAVNPVLREYTFKQTGGTDRVIMRLSYLNSELNGNTESNLVLWHKSSVSGSPGFEPQEHGKTAYSAADNWVEFAAPLVNFMAGDDFGVQRWGFAESQSLINIWLGLVSTSWKDRGNWSEGHFPGEIRNNGGDTVAFFDDNVLIPALTVYQPLVDTAARFKSVDIEAGTGITVGLDAVNEYYTVTVTGAPGVASAWSNNGTFIPGKGKVIFDGDSINVPISISGETDFYNLETSSTTYLQPASSTLLNIFGNLVVDTFSIIDLYSTDNTINFTGTESRTLINPKGPGGETGYYKLTVSHTAGEISFPAEMSIAGDFTNNISGTGSLKTTGSKIIFEDAGNNLAQYIRGISVTTFDSLIINNPMGIIAEIDITVNGKIEHERDNPVIFGKGLLDMSNGSTLNMGANAVTSGIGDVTGIIKRTHSFNDNTYYSFGAQNSGVTFASTSGQTKPSSITVRVTLGTAPDWSTDTEWSGNPSISDPIYRLYEISQTGGTGTSAIFRIHYRDDEIPPGVDENKLTIWSRVATGGTPAYYGIERWKSSHNTSENNITIQNMDFIFIPSTLGSFQTAIAPTSRIVSGWNGLMSTDWNTASNWNPSGVPSAATAVIIPDASLTPYSPVLPVSAACNYLSIENGGILNAAVSGGTLSLHGTGLIWSVAPGGTFDANTSTVEFLSTSGTLSTNGSTNFHNLTIAEGAILRPSADCYIGISGTFNIGGTLIGRTNGNAIDFNGSDQIITNPPGSDYHDLILGGTGTKTLPSSLYVAGSFTNNGAVDAFSNLSTVNMSGDGHDHNQVIDGSTPIIFNNLTIVSGSTTIIRSPQKAAGVVLVNGVLNSDGFLTLTSTNTGTACIDGSGSGQVNGNVIMERYLPSGYGYKYVSSPFNSSTVSEFADEIDMNSAFPLIYAFNENRYYDIYPLDPFYGYAHPANILEPFKGYAINLGDDASPLTFDITGVVNNGSLTIPLYNHNHPVSIGRNLVGNPYPSAIDWQSPEGWTKINVDDALFYFRASDNDMWGGTYSSWIQGVSSDDVASHIIPSMQGFLVHVTDGTYPVSGSLTIDNNARVIDHSQPYLKSNKGTPLIRFTACFSDNTLSPDFAVNYFDQESTLEFNKELDAFKMMNTDMNVPNMYFVTPSDVNLQIYALPPVLNSLCKVPLGINIFRDGEIIIKLRDIDPSFSHLRVSITDIEKGTEHDMLDNKELKIHLTSGEYKNRFFINYTDKMTSIDENAGDEDIFSIYYSRNSLHATIDQLQGAFATLTIYNLLGQTLFTEKIPAKGYYIINTQLKDGIYIATLVSGKIRTTKKISIRN
jgi:hypothetical protein